MTRHLPSLPPAPAAESRVTLEDVRRNHERQLKEKDDVIEAMKLKMNDMAEEFAEMLQAGPPFLLTLPFISNFSCFVLPPSSLLSSPLRSVLRLPSEPLSPRAQETLKRMGEKIEITSSKWEGDDSVPIARRMEDLSISSKA